MLDKKYFLEYQALRDFYEAYVLYSFTKLLINYLGGDKALLIHLEFKVCISIHPHFHFSFLRDASNNLGLSTA